MTRAWTNIQRHVSSRQSLTCRILRRWKKHVLAVDRGDMLSHVKSAVQENTEVTNHIGWWNTALWVKIEILYFLVIIQSASAVKPNEFCFRSIQLQRLRCTPGLDVMNAYAAILINF